MTKAATRDRQLMLFADIVETSSTASAYLRLVGESGALKDRAGMRYHMRCAIACVKSAVRSIKDLEELGAVATESEADE